MRTRWVTAISTAVGEVEVGLQEINTELGTLAQNIKDARDKHNTFLKELGLPALHRSFNKMYKTLKIKTIEVVGIYHALRAMRNPRMSHAKASADAKAIRGILAYAEFDCQIGWFVEWSTYRIGVDVLSTSSTMMLDLTGKKGEELAELKQKELSNVVYHQTALISYQTLRRIYFQRKYHRHPDWQVFCKWVETLPYANELIIIEKD